MPEGEKYPGKHLASPFGRGGRAQRVPEGEKYPESVKALHDAGHEVMSHSNHHDHFNSLSADQIIADVTASNERIAAASGVTPTLIRCPYGEYDDHVISAIRSMGMEPIQWDVEQPEMA